MHNCNFTLKKQMNGIKSACEIAKKVLGRIDSIEHMCAGRSNQLFKVRRGTEQFCLRVYRHDPDTKHLEVAALKQFAHLPVPDIVYRGEGFLLLRWLEGQPLNTMKPSMKLCADIGRILASIHSYSFPEPGLLDSQLRVSRSWNPYHDHFRKWMDQLLLGVCGERLGDIALKVKESLDMNLQTLSNMSSVFCHGDFKDENIICTGHRVTGVLDWEFCFSGPALADIGQLFRRQDLDLTSFAHGYVTAGGKLPSNWAQLSRMHDLLNMCYYLNEKPGRPELIRFAVKQIKITISSSEGVLKKG